MAKKQTVVATEQVEAVAAVEQQLAAVETVEAVTETVVVEQVVTAAETAKAVELPRTFTIEELQKMLQMATRAEEYKAFEKKRDALNDAIAEYMEAVVHSDMDALQLVRDSFVTVLNAHAVLCGSQVTEQQRQRATTTQVVHEQQASAPRKQRSKEANAGADPIGLIARETGLSTEEVAGIVDDCEAAKDKWKVKADGARHVMTLLKDFGCNVEETIHGGKLYLVHYMGFETGLAKTYCSNNYGKIAS